MIRIYIFLTLELEINIQLSTSLLPFGSTIQIDNEVNEVQNFAY